MTGEILPGGMRENPLGGKAGHADQEVQTRTDRDDAAADRSKRRERKNHPTRLKGSRDHNADVLPLAERVRRTEAGASRRLKDLEKENSRLRRLVAELSLEKQVLKDVASGDFNRSGVVVRWSVRGSSTVDGATRLPVAGAGARDPALRADPAQRRG